MRIISIDPGSIKTGFAVLDITQGIEIIQSGTIELNEGQNLGLRLSELSQDLEKILQKHRPQELALERIFFAKNPLSALHLGHARGVILMKCAEAGLESFEYTPTEVKQAVAGTGRATKEQVEHFVRLHFKLPKTFVMTSSDQSDALAIGLTHIRFRQSRQLYEMSGSRKETSRRDRPSHR